MPAPDLLALLNNQAPGHGVDNSPMAGDVGAGQGAVQPPMASGMTTPEPAAGQREAALINVHMALDLLEKAMQGVGSESPEGQQIHKALGSLTRVFGDAGRSQTAELAPSEILQLLNTLPQAGGASPEQKVVQGQPAVPGMAGGASMPPNMGAPGQGLAQ